MNLRYINHLCYSLLLLFIIFFLSVHHVNYIDYDAISYINFDSIRPPMYPFFIWLFSFAKKYQYDVVMWAQSAITISALFYAKVWLQNRLGVSNIFIFFVLLFTTITILLHYQLILIGSEGLSFPLFIISFFLLIDCFKELSLAKVFWLAFLISLLILTRVQFNYFYIIFFVLCIWSFYQKASKKLILRSIFIILLSIVFTNTVNKGYHYFKHETITSKLEVDLYHYGMLFVQPIYLVKDSFNFDLIKNQNERIFVGQMVKNIHNLKLNQDANLPQFKPSYYEYAYEEYNRNHDKIYMLSMDVLKNFPLAEASKILQQATFDLLKLNFTKNLTFSFWKLIEFFGGVPLFIFFIIITSGFISTLFNKNYKQNYMQIFVVVSMLVTFLHLALLALVQMYTAVYCCYVQFILYCFAALIADQIFIKSHNKLHSDPAIHT